MKKISTWFINRYLSIKNKQQKQFIEEVNDAITLKLKNGKFLLSCRGIVIKEYQDGCQIKNIADEINNILELNKKYINVYYH